MVSHYDLVIIGDTPVGRYAAFRAIDLKLRVALVQQPFIERKDGIETIFRQRWRDLSRFARQGQQLQQWDMIEPLSQFRLFSLENESYEQSISLKQLGEMGGDIILESGYFEQKNQLYWMTETRTLQASAYLIATGSRYSQPMIQGLAEVGYMDFLQVKENFNHLAQNIAVIAETSVGIELAQALNRLGKKVTLIIEDYRLLPQQETDIIRYLQAQLEAEGIELFVDAPVTHVKVIENQKWIQIGSHAIATDEIIITSHPQPNLEGLNLSEIGVETDKKGIKINQKLQTTHSQIYAIGSVTGNCFDLNAGQAEANVALKNIIGFPFFKYDEKLIPSVILTDPTLAKIGLTENQARKYYQDRLIIIEQNYYPLSQARLFDEAMGKIKMITRLNGQIVGVHILGYHAEEYISAIALAMQNQIPLPKLSQTAFISESFSSILSQVILQYRQQRLKHYAKWPNFIQAWFI